MSLRDQIINSMPTIEAVEAFGTTGYVREMDADTVISFTKWVTANPNHADFEAMLALLVRTVCDEHGTRQFTDDESGLLRGKGHRELRKLYAVAERLNTVTQKDVDAAKGNSPATTC